MEHMMIFMKYIDKLIKALPMNDIRFTTQLASNGILPPGVASHIEALSTSPDKADHFLKNAIKTSLDIDETDEFNKLITVMEKCGYSHVERMANKMKSDLDKELKVKSSDDTEDNGKKPDNVKPATKTEVKKSVPKSAESSESTKGKGKKQDNESSNSTKGKGKKQDNAESSNSTKGKGKKQDNAESSDSTKGKGKKQDNVESSDSAKGKGKKQDNAESSESTKDKVKKQDTAEPSDSAKGKGKKQDNESSESTKGKGKKQDNAESSDSAKGKGKKQDNAESSDSTKGKGKKQDNDVPLTKEWPISSCTSPCKPKSNFKDQCSELENQAKNLHNSFDCDVVILVHKPNVSRGSWFNYATEGKAKEFLNKHESWWKLCMKNPAIPSATPSSVATSPTLVGQPIPSTSVGQLNVPDRPSDIIHNTQVAAHSVTSSSSSSSVVRSSSVEQISDHPKTSLVSSSSVVSHSTVSSVSSDTFLIQCDTQPVPKLETLPSVSSSSPAFDCPITSLGSSNSLSPSHPTTSSATEMVTSHPITPQTGNRKRQRCGKCDGCKRLNCGTCKHCEKPSLKKACINRKCSNI